MSKKGKKYVEAAKQIEAGKLYSIEEAIELVKKTTTAKFDASVDVVFKLNLDTRHADQQLRGAIVLPNGTGKTKRVCVIAEGPKAEEAKNDFENQLIEQVIDNMECEVPQCMFDKRADEMVQDYAYRLQMQGIDLDTYLKYLGQDKDAFKATFKDGAEKQVKASIALEAIVEAEKLEATEEEIDAEIAKLAEQYQMEADQIKKAVPADQIAADVKTKKAIDIIVDSAVKE